MTHPFNNQQGNAIIAVLMLTAVMGAMAIYATRAVEDGAKYSAKLKQKSEVEAIGMKLLQAVDCEKSFASVDIATCTGQRVKLVDESGAELLSSSGVDTQIGKYRVAAQCFPTGLNVRAVRLKPGYTDAFTADPSALYPDKVSGKLLDANHSMTQVFPLDRFPAGPVCAPLFNGTGRADVRIYPNLADGVTTAAATKIVSTTLGRTVHTVDIPRAAYPSWFVIRAASCGPAATSYRVNTWDLGCICKPILDPPLPSTATSHRQQFEIVVQRRAPATAAGPRCEFQPVIYLAPP